MLEALLTNKAVRTCDRLGESGDRPGGEAGEGGLGGRGGWGGWGGGTNRECWPLVLSVWAVVGLRHHSLETSARRLSPLFIPTRAQSQPLFLEMSLNEGRPVFRLSMRRWVPASLSVSAPGSTCCPDTCMITPVGGDERCSLGCKAGGEICHLIGWPFLQGFMGSGMWQSNYCFVLLFWRKHDLFCTRWSFTTSIRASIDTHLVNWQCLACDK